MVIIKSPEGSIMIVDDDSLDFWCDHGGKQLSHSGLTEEEAYDEFYNKPWEEDYRYD